MLIIADSGSTKTSWIVRGHDGSSAEFNTSGLNPNHSTAGEIASVLRSELINHTAGAETPKIFFYGSGCSGPETIAIVRSAFNSVIPGAALFIGSDLLGAARALLGDRTGIACILGTGSNTGLYNGSEIIANTPPLGFILGDEGSGTYLGKIILADLLRGIMPEKLADNFRQRYDIDTEKILKKVYRGEFPARYVSGFVSFIHENIGETYMRKSVESAFQLFIDRNIRFYKGYRSVPLCFTGSVAWIFSDILNDILQKNGLKAGELLRNPARRIMEYHLTHNTK